MHFLPFCLLIVKLHIILSTSQKVFVSDLNMQHYKKKNNGE